MSNIRQYRYLHRGDNDFLSQPLPPDATEEDAKLYNEQWAEINADNTPDIKVEFTEELYSNSEWNDLPEWVNVTIDDSGVLPFKMARGILGALDGARGIVFHGHFSVDMPSDWGGWSYCRLEVSSGGAYLTIVAKHSSDEIELNITEQFNQATGE
jgi:hypothetical protein